MIEKLEPFVTISTLNGGTERPINTVEIALKINELIEAVNSIQNTEVLCDCPICKF